MKKKLFPLTVFLFCVSLFCSNTFAQEPPGYWGSGGQEGVIKIQPSPVSFKRNNGNGTCGGEGQIRVVFDVIPDYFPAIAAVQYEGIIIPVHIDPIDGSMLPKKGYASYCIDNTNIPPAKKLAIKFIYPGTPQTCWLVEANPF